MNKAHSTYWVIKNSHGFYDTESGWKADRKLATSYRYVDDAQSIAANIQRTCNGNFTTKVVRIRPKQTAEVFWTGKVWFPGIKEYLKCKILRNNKTYTVKYLRHKQWFDCIVDDLQECLVFKAAWMSSFE